MPKKQSVFIKKPNTLKKINTLIEGIQFRKQMRKCKNNTDLMVQNYSNTHKNICIEMDSILDKLEKYIINITPYDTIQANIGEDPAKKAGRDISGRLYIDICTEGLEAGNELIDKLEAISIPIIYADVSITADTCSMRELLNAYSDTLLPRYEKMVKIYRDLIIRFQNSYNGFKITKHIG